MIDSFSLNGITIPFSKINSGEIKGSSSFEQNTISFIKDWISNKQLFTLSTSGSTGQPKKIEVKRLQIIASVNQTASFLELKESQSALICLDTSKVAGIMMLARGLELGMKMTVITPTSTPLQNIQDTFDFCAMVPLQVQSTSSKELNQINKLIIGGGTINEDLESRLKDLTNSTYHTYGMTETLSHVALREITPHNSYQYSFLPHIDFKTNHDDCLCIKSPVTENQWVETNDIVKLDDDKFTWLGRIDNTINSGGYKINLDILKTKIEKLNPDFEFVLSSIPDHKLGDKLVLISLKEYTIKLDHLDFYEKPKQLFKSTYFPLLASGKIDNQKVKRYINEYIEWGI